MTNTKNLPKDLPKEVQEKIESLNSMNVERGYYYDKISMKQLAHWYEERLEKSVNEAYIKAAMEAL